MAIAACNDFLTVFVHRFGVVTTFLRENTQW